MAKPAKKGRPVAKEAAVLPFGKRNYLAFIIGLVVIVAGFIFLAVGDTVFAPILLVAGYCVIIPVAILMGDKKEGGTQG
ncbi:hypothetical protein ACFLQW_01200 [Candidatus Zixiibacteriota bacterium]